MIFLLTCLGNCEASTVKTYGECFSGALKITKQKETSKKLKVLHRICLAIALVKINHFCIFFVQICSSDSSRYSGCTRVFQSFSISKRSFRSYFQWNPCTYFQKIWSWTKDSNAKLTKIISDFLVALLRFCLRKTT